MRYNYDKMSYKSIKLLLKIRQNVIIVNLFYNLKNSKAVSFIRFQKIFKPFTFSFYFDSRLVYGKILIV